MLSFLALYRGNTLRDAEVVALSSAPEIIREFAERLLAQAPEGDEGDPVLRAAQEAKRSLLRVVRQEAGGAGTEREGENRRTPVV